MKYKVKYLPCEGEIIIGDKYTQNGVVLTIGEGIQRLAGGGETQKVKLYLCSNEINVGDKVIHINPINTIQYHKELTILELTRYGDYVTKEGVYTNLEVTKIMGSISDKAIWVKEDDIINENNISFYAKHRSFPDMNFHFHPMEEFDEIVDEHDNVKYSIVCKILCDNCKTYH